MVGISGCRRGDMRGVNACRALLLLLRRQVEPSCRRRALAALEISRDRRGDAFGGSGVSAGIRFAAPDGATRPAPVGIDAHSSTCRSAHARLGAVSSTRSVGLLRVPHARRASDDALCLCSPSTCEPASLGLHEHLLTYAHARAHTPSSPTRKGSRAQVAMERRGWHQPLDQSIATACVERAYLADSGAGEDDSHLLAPRHGPDPSRAGFDATASSWTTGLPPDAMLSVTLSLLESECSSPYD